MVAAAVLAWVSGAASAPAYASDDGVAPPPGPLPMSMREVPPLADQMELPADVELDARAEARDYASDIRQLRRKHFGRIENAEIRARGIEQIAEFTDPAAFLILFDELGSEQDDVRLALLDHYKSQGDWGQAALGFIVLHTDDEAMHYESLKRIEGPVGPPLLNVIDAGLRSDHDFVANMAGRLAGHLDIFDAIPLLIHGQARNGPIRRTGDQAWILVGNQRAFIRALVPIVGENGAAFMPVPGVLTDGVVMRIVEAVAIIYRTEIHTTLVAMTTKDWGRSTAHLGYDREAWRQWYDQEYLPYKTAQYKAEQLARQPHRKVIDEK